MLSFRRAVLLSLLLSFLIFFLYPRHPHNASEPGRAPGARRPGRVPPADDSNDSAMAVPKDAKGRQQLSISDLEKLPVQDQLAYQFPYRVSSKFPAYIWQTWKYTPSNPMFDEKFRDLEASWTEKHPTFVHEVGDVCGGSAGWH